MTKIQSVVGILLKDQEILLLQRKEDDRTYQGHCLVGGKVDAGESLVTALAREVKEEIGLDVVASEFYKTHENDQFIIHFYRIEVNNASIQLNLEEFDAYGFYPLDALPEDTLPITKKVLQTLKI